MKFFIGDTQIADVDGPQKLGMSAKIIDRKMVRVF